MLLNFEAETKSLRPKGQMVVRPRPRPEVWLEISWTFISKENSLAQSTNYQWTADQLTSYQRPIFTRTNKYDMKTAWHNRPITSGQLISWPVTSDLFSQGQINMTWKQLGTIDQLPVDSWSADRPVTSDLFSQGQINMTWKQLGTIDQLPVDSWPADQLPATYFHKDK